MLKRYIPILHHARPFILSALLLAGAAHEGLAQPKPAAAPLARAKDSAKGTSTTHSTTLTTQGMILTAKTIAPDGTTTITTRTYGTLAGPFTRDTLGVYSSRPLLAVGDVKEINATSQTITVRIDRSLSSLPHILETQAQKKGVLEKLQERAFPAERTFFIRRSTMMLDGSGKAPKVSALTSQRERLERTRLKLEDFHPGDRVSVLFRYHENEKNPPAVMNISKQPRERRDYTADYRPIPIVQRVINPSSATLAQTPATSQTLKAAPAAPATALEQRKARPDRIGTRLVPRPK